jgi:hypothetical protein
VNNYNNAIEILTEFEGDSEFMARLKSFTDGGVKGKSIYTYLIMPIQRVPRYILLLNVSSPNSSQNLHVQGTHIRVGAD